MPRTSSGSHGRRAHAENLFHDDRPTWSLIVKGVLHALDRHVALVGFMGAGKSTLGPGLANRLGRPFVSIDALVEERAGLSVTEVFETRGLS